MNNIECLFDILDETNQKIELSHNRIMNVASPDEIEQLLDECLYLSDRAVNIKSIIKKLSRG